LVERGKLLRQLDGILKMKLAVVSAPAGFGKSTLLAQWAQRCRETSIAVGWLSLDEGDDDFGRFIEYFVAALQKLAPNVGREVLALVRSSPILRPLSTHWLK
jgi:LuxR family maltose regulon positive regulatory protein